MQESAQTAVNAFLILATQAYGTPGGIAAVTRRAMEVLSPRAVVSVISLNDGAQEKWRHQRPIFSRFIGVRRSIIRFVWSVFVEAIRCGKAPTVIVMHLNLVPVALILRTLRLVDTYICWLHGIEAWRRQSLIRRLALRRADRLISVSRYTSATFCHENEISELNVSIVPLGLDLDQLPNILQEALPNAPGKEDVTAPRLLTVTRMESSERYKGVDALIEAVRIVSATVKVTLTVVGDGSDRERLMVRAEGLPIRFLGRISDGELADQYQSSDIFVLASSGEGFGIVYLEAMSFGKPCIALRQGAITEVLTDNADSVLIENTDQLPAAIERLCSDRTLRERLGRGARSTVEERFLFAGFASRLLQALED